MTTLGREVKRNLKTRWKKIGVLVLIISLLGSIIAFPPQAKADDGLSLFYTVTIEKDKPTFQIKIAIENLPKGNFKFGLSNGLAICNPSYITNVKSNKGVVRYTKANLWEINVQEKGNVTIDYDVSKIIPNKNSISSSQIPCVVYIDNNGGEFLGQCVFLIPLSSSSYTVTNIRVKFNFPDEWQIVCPYIENKNYYEVPQITKNLLFDFVERTIYFGKMKFYSENKSGNCKIEFGFLTENQSFQEREFLKEQEDLDSYTKMIAKALDKITKIFGNNPYPVITIVSPLQRNNYVYGQPSIFGSVQHWPPGRYDEAIGHLFYIWMHITWSAPVGTSPEIFYGFNEIYLGNKIAYEITNEKRYLGKIYAFYLVYKGIVGTKYENDKSFNGFFKGSVEGLYLDNLIQKETGGKKSLEDVEGYLYNKYKNTGITVGNKQLEEAVDAVTGQNNSEVFNKYIYGNEEIPVDDIIQPYKEDFPEFIKTLDSDNWVTQNYHGYTIPFFLNTEIAARSKGVLLWQVLLRDHYKDFAKEILENNNIDVNKLTKQDVIDVLNRITGTDDNSNFFEQWKDSYGELSLDEMKEWLNSYLPYPPKNLNASFKGNAVVLNWDQVRWRYTNDYYRIIGYNIYRGTSSGKENKIATVGSNSYTDTNIESGKTYYYYVKSIEDQPFRDGIHIASEPSKEIKIVCKDTTPPTLSITSPENSTVVNEDTITVSGTATDKESGIDKVTVNGNNVSVSSDGSFSTTVNLTEGTNTITVIAIDKAGNKASKTITVTYEKPVQTITITLQPDNPYMTVNGVQQEIDPGRGTTPVIIKEWSRTVVPIRAIVEALGGTISWNGTERKVTINFKDTTIELWIDNPQANVNGIEKWIDPKNHNVKPIIVNQRTMLPLRFVAESLGCTVDWNGTTRTITITYEG